MLLRVAIFHYRMGKRQGGEEKRKLSVHEVHAAHKMVCASFSFKLLVMYERL
jgi:hypothetical protein